MFEPTRLNIGKREFVLQCLDISLLKQEQTGSCTDIKMHGQGLNTAWDTVKQKNFERAKDILYLCRCLAFDGNQRV